MDDETNGALEKLSGMGMTGLASSFHFSSHCCMHECVRAVANNLSLKVQDGHIRVSRGLYICSRSGGALL